MRREIRFAARSLRRRPLVRLVGWSVPEALPAAASGLVVARAVDDGFLAGRPLVGVAWLVGLVVVSGVGAVGTRMVFRRLGDLAEPFRDELVRRVVGGALRHAVDGRADDGAVARLTRQVEIVRDTYAGLLMAVRGFVVTVVGVAVGLLSVAPVVAALIMPPFLLGLVAFVGMLGLAATRQREAVLADERLAAAAGSVLAGARDVSAAGTEEHAAGMVAGPIGEQATAERRLAGVAALRTLCFAVGGWLPLLVVLFAGSWLVDRGLTAGAIMGGLTYVLFGLQPALQNLVSGVGGSGLRFVVTLGRLLDATTVPPATEAAPRPTQGHDLELRGVTFAYGPHAEPVLRDLDLTVRDGEHLAVVGPSGIGKSTLASLLCGLLRPDGGTVTLGGVPAADLPPDRLAELRVLIPQEAYVFAGTVRENLTYLCPGESGGSANAGGADGSGGFAKVGGGGDFRDLAENGVGGAGGPGDSVDLDAAVAAVGAGELVARLGGYTGAVRPAELSAGERQLLALVRAYLSPAPVVVLDEATCHLDPVAERRAEEAFAARGGTLVVIAHRTSSAMRAGRVLVLDGTGAQDGDHETLAATSPLYRDLVAASDWRPAVPL